MAPRHGRGRSTAGRRPGRAPSPGRRRRPGARRPRACATRPGVPVTAAAGRSGVCGGAVPVYGGVVLDLCGLAGIVDVDDASLLLDVLAGHLRRRSSRTSCARRPRRHPRALAAVDRAVDRRRLARLPRRRSVLDPLRQDRGHGRRPRRRAGRRPGRSAPAAQPPPGRRARPHPGVRRLARARSASSPGPGSGSTRRPPTSAAPPSGSPSFAAGLDACRRILRRGATPAVLRLYDAIGVERNYETERATTSCSCSTRATARSSTPRWRSSPRSARRPALDDDLVDHWLEHRNDVSALEALIATRLRRRHHGDRRAVVGAAAPSTRPRRRDRRRAGTLAVSAHQSHAYIDGACLYFTFAGAGRARRPRRATTPAAWDAGTRAVLAARRRAQPPPRRRAQPRPVRARRARPRPSTCSPR